MLIFYYTYSNRFGFNALAGAIERYRPDIKKIHLAKKEADLLTLLKSYPGRKTVAFSFFTAQKEQIGKIILRLREKFPGDELFLIAGGPHASGAPRDTLEMGFDAVAAGEGESLIIKHFFPEGQLRQASGEREGRVKGIIKGEKINLDDYPPVSEKFGLYGPIEITRGCPYACNFCQTSRIFGTLPRHRSIKNITAAVKIIKAKGFSSIRFITPDLFSYGSKDGKKIEINAVEELFARVKETAGENMKVYGGSFPSEVRPEHVTRETVAIIKKYADNDNLLLGAQSGSERILKSCHRGHTADDVLNAVSIIRKNGLRVSVDIIFGLPGEEEQDILDTVALMKKLSAQNARIHTHFFMPLPGTGFAESEPGIMDDRAKKLVSLLASRGLAFGQWEKQMQIAASRFL